ncbi:MAG: hypothetical protein M5R38_16160 [Candidatus Methylomirabilis sp.]|nr:hypothetical protein [Candidatus Methylomirabilis sp.]
MKSGVRMPQRGTVQDVHPARLNAAPARDAVEAKTARRLALQLECGAQARLTDQSVA